MEKVGKSIVFNIVTGGSDDHGHALKEVEVKVGAHLSMVDGAIDLLDNICSVQIVMILNR
jgi:hypothetical protein